MRRPHKSAARRHSAYLDEWLAEHGAFTEEEMARAQRKCELADEG